MYGFSITNIYDTNFTDFIAKLLSVLVFIWFQYYLCDSSITLNDFLVLVLLMYTVSILFIRISLVSLTCVIPIGPIMLSHVYLPLQIV